MGNFKEDIVKTEAFVFDVDGVFTDGGITPFGDDFIRRYYAKDGYAVSYASKLGYKICIITGGRGKWLQERFERLRVTKIYAGRRRLRDSGSGALRLRVSGRSGLCARHRRAGVARARPVGAPRQGRQLLEGGQIGVIAVRFVENR